MELLHSLLFMLNEMSPYILLGFLIAGVMHAFIPQKTFARHLSGRGFKSVFKSALIGVPLPLCSCGVLPTAIAMRRNGASKASSTSFLIATPQTGVDSIAATWSLLGPAFAVVRPIAAFITAIFGGVAVGRAEDREESVEAPTASSPAKNSHGAEHTHSHAHAGHDHGAACAEGHCGVDFQAEDSRPKGFRRRSLAALKYGYVDLVASIGGWLVVGLIIAAVITVYVPKDFFGIFGATPILSMIVVLLIAIPMYVCATGSIPIAMSLMLKGLSPGTALVLLMAGPAANFASFTLISREMGRRSALVYLASIIIGAIAFGLAIDYLLPSSWFLIGHADALHAHAHGFNLFPTLCSALLVALLLYSFISRRMKKKTVDETTAVTAEYIVKGMNCPHCQAAVTKSISGVEGVVAVDVDLKSGRAVVEGPHDAETVRAAVRAAGFDID